MSKCDNKFYYFGRFSIDAANGLLLRDGEEVPLQRKAFELLLCLIEHKGQVLTKTQLLETLWPDTSVEESNLTQHVYLIRRALSEGAGGASPIVTIPGRGYRFTAEVRVEKAPEPSDERALTDRAIETAAQGGLSASLQEPAEDDERLPAITKPGASLSPSPSDLSPARRPMKVIRLAPLLLGIAILAAAGIGLSLYRTSTALPPARIKPFTTLPGAETDPSFSPDGKQLAFAWDRDGSGDSDIYIKLIDAGLPLQLTSSPETDHQPAWSPDGNYLAFLRRFANRQEMRIVPALGGPERMIGEVVRGLDWSPDGRWLAVIDREAPGAPEGVFLISVETRERRQVTASASTSSSDFFPTFSPDGKWIAFGRAISSGIEEIFIVPVEGGEARQLTFDNRRLEGLCWTHDAKEIIFSSDRDGAFRLWRLPASGGAPQRIDLAGSDAFTATIARRGSLMAYSQRYSDTNIWRLTLEPEAKKAPAAEWERLIVSSRQEDSPQYSPDGGKIAFASNRSGSAEIWVCNRDGSNPVQVTSFGGPQTGSPRWSPDGEWIAFDSRPEGHSDIFIVNVHGTQLRRLTTEGAADVVPSWSRDGRSIYFCSDRTGERQIWKVSIDGGAALQMTRDGGFEAIESPDGKYLYYAKRYIDGIWQMGVDGGDGMLIPELSRAGYFRYWGVHESGVYFVPRETSSRPAIYFFDPLTRRVRSVSALERPPISGPAGLSVSPDGRSILYAQEDLLASDIMLVEHFR